jgi:hypothetical protein
MTKKKPHTMEFGFSLLPERHEVTSVIAKRRQERLDRRDKEENISAVVGLLVVAIVFIIGINIGLFVANFLKEPTWHTPKGCPVYVGGK